ncbi:hypothetical protein HZR84_08725 [Hyphobacterium sp. CCMP332]|nr:hypothetical protein HZR84_08725 [Hyphobacterium sp. CCMP332]
MNIKNAILFLIIAIISGCGVSGDPEPDEQIFGTWTDEIVTITFLEDQTYGQKNLIDNPLDTANLDSTFGNYYSDKENRVISFTITGFTLENGTILDSTIIGPTWVYTITETGSQTEMSYQSNTTIGTLVKIDP